MPSRCGAVDAPRRAALATRRAALATRRAALIEYARGSVSEASTSTAAPFRLLLRVRYNECDAQGIVFNARWADYADIASTEYVRALFGSVHPAETGLDWRLVKQTTEWQAPGRYDDVLDLAVRTLRVGTTSFALETRCLRHADRAPLAAIETVCVMVDHAGVKRPIPAEARAAFERGAPGLVVDHAGAKPPR
jgi:acyl-CoA thioester hydrolase